MLKGTRTKDDPLGVDRATTISPWTGHLIMKISRIVTLCLSGIRGHWRMRNRRMNTLRGGKGKGELEQDAIILHGCCPEISARFMLLLPYVTGSYIVMLILNVMCSFFETNIIRK